MKKQINHVLIETREHPTEKPRARYEQILYRS
jgi:hypothetical protein